MAPPASPVTKFTASKPVMGRPENTLPLFDGNRSCGCPGVEVSVRSRPTQPVVPIGWMFDARFELWMLFVPEALNVMTFVSWQSDESGWPGGYGENPQPDG